MIEGSQCSFQTQETLFKTELKTLKDKQDHDGTDPEYGLQLVISNIQNIQ